MGRINLWVLLGLALLAVSNIDVQVRGDVAPSVDQCRPYIEQAINELKTVEAVQTDSDRAESEEPASVEESVVESENVTPVESVPDDNTAEESIEQADQPADTTIEQESQEKESTEGDQQTEENQTLEADQEASEESQEPAEGTETQEEQEAEDNNTDEEGDSQEQTIETETDDGDSEEGTTEAGQTEEEQQTEEILEEKPEESGEDTNEQKDDSEEATEEKPEESGEDTEEQKDESTEITQEKTAEAEESNEGDNEKADDSEAVESTENKPEESGEDTEEKQDSGEDSEEKQDSGEDTEDKPVESVEETEDSGENTEEKVAESEEDGKTEETSDDDKTEEEKSGEAVQGSDENNTAENADTNEDEKSGEDDNEESQENATEDDTAEESTEEPAAEETTEQKSDEESTEQAADAESDEENTETTEQETATDEQASTEEQQNTDEEGDSQEPEETVRVKRSLPDETTEEKSGEDSTEGEEADGQPESGEENADTDDDDSVERPIEDLTLEFEIPKNLRDRSHIAELLGLDEESSIKENALRKTGEVVLKDLKQIYDRAIKPLEGLYKYRDLSNRHFGDPEIFSKPLVLFMGPWSGGKSTILNYLTDNEYTPNSIRSGAEPSPAYFNIMMYGDEPEVLDGTQLAADWTFAGLQKFGQGLNDRLRGQKLPNKLLERVNIVEIPGILEVRKQVSKYFPFNDACQWFIDRADIIFLVYDPSKLDVGPETEAILDQLKGREYQTRILLNKADQVKPEELLRVQGALIWNISPLMSSAQPPVMYTVSLWSHPYESGAPVRLLQAQERAFLTDLREAIDKRIENKIASARRFAVRIRNHCKMVDCYLTTYYNQKTLFSNKKAVADNIIEHPQNFNIYEGLSTLTNISRYDLPDPEVYMDFFKLNPLYNFKRLSETCTYFKGCPIGKLDLAIAYDLPELVGKYKKLLETNILTFRKQFDENCNTSAPEPTPKILASR